MNPEITKLQILNDLIAQTLDVITQRTLMAQRAAMFGGGLSHSPYGADPRFAGQGYGPQGYAPQGFAPQGPQAWGQQGYGVDPRINTGFGLNHTPAYGVDPRLAYGFAPAYGIDPRLGVPSQVWGQGLSHTGIDPRFTAHGLGVAHAINGINWNNQAPTMWPQQNWNLAGLQHTPYVDPRLAYDPRIAFNAAPVMGIDPRLGYGINGF